MKHKKYFIVTLLVTMISMWALVPPMPMAKAVGTITNASVTMSDSDLTASSSLTFDFTTATNTPQTGFWRLTFDVGANDYDLTNAVAVCAYGDGNFTASTSAASLTSGTIECVRSGGGTIAATTTQIVVYNVINPDTAGAQYITIGNYDNIDVYNERVKVASFIIDDVIVTATVDSSLTFTVDATTTPRLGTSLYDCSDNKTSAATATSVPFGTLVVDDPDNICQELTVTTNAQDGYIVTIEQDHELLSDSGATIDSFREAGAGGGTTTPEAWASPANTLDYYNTYGHMGITSDDNAVIAGSGLENFNNGEWFAGMAGTALMTVMDHNGPSDGYSENVGMATIMFRAEIASLQEAGDYQATLTYICTPTF